MHGAKLGLYGGSIGGIGLALFRLFKVKGFLIYVEKDPGRSVGIVLSAITLPKKMPLASLDHRQIADVVKRAGESLQPLEHLLPG